MGLRCPSPWPRSQPPSPTRLTAALVIFALTYLVIALRELPFTHLDRPSGALLGAALMVALGVLKPEEVYQRAVSWDTIGLLLGMVALTAYLGEASFFRRASWLSLHWRGPSGASWSA